MQNALAMAINPPKIDIATPLMQAAQLRQAQAQTDMADLQMRQQALGAEARGVAVYAGTPEFGQKWAEMADRLRSQNVISPDAHQQWRNAPSPLLLRQIIAQTENPQIALQRELHSPAHISATERAKQTVLAEFAPKTTTIERDGERTTVITGPKDEKGQPTFALPTITGAPSVPNNPYATGKTTEAQAKDGLYANRMFASEQILRDPDVVAAATTISNRQRHGIPLIGNYLVGNAYQRFDQAQRDFINATLRRESGAVISDAEFDNARKQYFPQPGDTPDVLEQKRRNRETAIKGFAAGAGQSFKPPLIFGPDGSIIPNPALKRPDEPTVAKPTTPSKSAAPVKIATRADYDKLDKGQQYIAADDPEQKVRTKQ